MQTLRLHPRLTSHDGTRTAYLASIGPFGAWSDLNVMFRWGQGPCGMYEASWQMPLPVDFDHDLLRVGTVVELMDGPWRAGSPLIMGEPTRGHDYSQPWQIVCTGIGREVEGENSWYALDGSLNTTTVPATAVDRAIASANGWALAGRDYTIPGSPIGAASASDNLQSVGALLTAAADGLGRRWGVGQDNYLRFMDDPTAPLFQVVSGAAVLGQADDDYASVVLARYNDSTTGLYTTVEAEDTTASDHFRRIEYPVNLVPLGAISAATAQGFADGILAKSKGRLSWTNGITVSSNDIYTMGGVPADLLSVAEAVGAGCMLRHQGLWDDALPGGQTYLDVIAGEAKYVDGSPTLDINPLGLAPRVLADIVESLTGMAAA